jgi:hypothetical protein
MPVVEYKVKFYLSVCSEMYYDVHGLIVER